VLSGRGADGVPSAPKPEKEKRWATSSPQGSPYRQKRGNEKRDAVLLMKKVKAFLYSLEKM